MLELPRIMLEPPRIMLKAPRIMVKAPRIILEPPRIMVKAPRIMRKAPNKMPFDHLRQLWLSIRATDLTTPRSANVLMLISSYAVLE